MNDKGGQYGQLINLINLWQDFEQEKNENKSLDQFAIWLLTKSNTDQAVFSDQLKKIANIPTEAVINILLLRLARSLELQMKPIFFQSPISYTDYRILACVEARNNPRKVEVIHEIMVETTTATAMMKNLIEKDFISEEQDTEDKRSKRISLLPKGQAILNEKRQQVVAMLPKMYPILSLEEKQNFIVLLSRIDRFFSNL